MVKDNSHYEGVLLEEFRDQIKFIIEALKALKDVPSDIQHIKKRLDNADDWRDIAKLVIKDQSKTLNAHETRLTKLETA